MTEYDFTDRMIQSYQIREKLGEGGMAVVYRAWDNEIQRPVAIKFISARLLHDHEVVRRFLGEAQNLGRVSHHNVVTVFGAGTTDDGFPYLVTELLEGVSLEKRIAKGPLPIRHAVSIARQAARGLGAAHREGLIHRDLKPSNVYLLKPSGPKEPYDVKVLDFGLAKTFGPVDVSHLTTTGTVLGTVKYMSPEQAQAKQLGPATDIYSLGLIVYEMLCGQLPFQASTPSAWILCHVIEKPLPITRRAPGIHVPAPLEDIVMRCLEKEPERRYAGTKELLEALDMVDLAVDRGVKQSATPERTHALAGTVSPYQQMMALPEIGSETRTITIGQIDDSSQPPADERTGTLRRRALPPADMLPRNGSASLPASRATFSGGAKIALPLLLFVVLGALVARHSFRSPEPARAVSVAPSSTIPTATPPSESRPAPLEPPKPTNSDLPKEHFDNDTSGVVALDQLALPSLPALPRTMVFVEETVTRDPDGEPSSSSHAETILIKVLTENGLPCLDPVATRAKVEREMGIQAIEGNNDAAARIGREANADVIVVAKAAAESQGNILQSEIRSYAGVITARAVSAGNARVLMAESERATAAHINPELAAGFAIERAAAALGAKLAPVLLAEPSGTSKEVELLITGLHSYSELNVIEEVFQRRLGSSNIATRSFSKQLARIDLRVTGDANRLASTIEATRFRNLRLTVTLVSANKIETVVRR